jgi:hypothetical protein
MEQTKVTRNVQMPMITSGRGFTFAVHDVEPVTAPPKRTVKTPEAVSALVGGRPEAVCDLTADCLAGVGGHPLLAAVHRAWCDHRPLALSPDMLWVTILQGLALHVRNNAEALRRRFVSHDGGKVIAVSHDGLHDGSPENPWPEVVAMLTAGVREEIGRDKDWLAADFSTTGRVERTAAEIVLLDAMSPYFEYRVYAGCGIPAVTLEGSVEDWRKLADKVGRLADFELDWWLRHLRPIADHFVRAASGRPDMNFWRNIYKRLDQYGGYIVSGWIAKLFPYLKHFQTGDFTERNRLLEGRFEPYPSAPAVPVMAERANRFAAAEPGISPGSVPTGLSGPPFTYHGRRGEPLAMDLLGGFVGVTHDPATGALRPKLGWAVRRASDLDQLVARVRGKRHEAGGRPVGFAEAFDNLRKSAALSLPDDFRHFYSNIDGAGLFAGSGPDTSAGVVPAVRLRPFDRLEAFDPVRPTDLPKDARSTLGYPRPWLRFADLPDGRTVALLTEHTQVDVNEAHTEEVRRLHRFDLLTVQPVILCNPREADPRRAHRVVAWSFAEFLKLALDSGPIPYFDEPGYLDRGDAFTEPRWTGPLPGPWTIRGYAVDRFAAAADEDDDE